MDPTGTPGLEEDQQLRYALKVQISSAELNQGPLEYPICSKNQIWSNPILWLIQHAEFYITQMACLSFLQPWLMSNLRKKLVANEVHTDIYTYMRRSEKSIKDVVIIAPRLLWRL